VKKKDTGKEMEIKAEKIMVAVGRESNADLLRVQNTGVETTEAHYLKVNDYLQTTKKNIWALGDAIGRQMFTHAASKEVELAWHNATQKRKRKMNFRIVPHAIFMQPQIASVGLTEKQANKVLGYCKRGSHDGRRGLCKGNRGKRHPKDFGIPHDRS
jgi:dihydrolipoamide dehydrogenase